MKCLPLLPSRSLADSGARAEPRSGLTVELVRGHPEGCTEEGTCASLHKGVKRRPSRNHATIHFEPCSGQRRGPSHVRLRPVLFLRGRQQRGASRTLIINSPRLAANGSSAPSPVNGRPRDAKVALESSSSASPRVAHGSSTMPSGLPRWRAAPQRRHDESGASVGHDLREAPAGQGIFGRCA